MEDEEFARVEGVAQQLYVHLNKPRALKGIAASNQPGTSSVLIQGVFRPFAKKLGFVDESNGLFSEYETRGLRPDYFMPLGSTGILLEVERGKTIINNMDLLDFWKCHLCSHAHYLFLLVPCALRQNESMKPTNAFLTSSKRLGTFFTPGNYTNVRGLFLFGY